MSDPPATPGTACPECGQLRAALDEALQPIARLQAELHELRGQLNRNSSNSSSPPSADPPGAPKPVVKTQSGRKPGGQPGHPGSHRRRLPSDRVQKIVPYVPTTCTRCQAPLPEQPAPGDPEPSGHQVADLPPLAAIVTAHRGHARTGPGCGHLNREEIPAAIRAHVIGPRLAAVMSDLTGRHHLSRRAVAELVETVFEVPIALGTVIAWEAETTAALAGAYREVQEEVRGAAVKDTDETGWSEAGQRRWLWMAATATAALFVIHLRRGFAGLKALLGEVISGVVCSDRWSADSRLPWELRQICWAPLKRDFQKLIDRGGPADAIGRVGREVVDCLFADGWAFRRGELGRPGRRARVERMAHELQSTLERGRTCADAKAATFCADLLALYPALWRFATIEGVEPTNNPAERRLRSGVLWRKNAFGCHSASGCRFVERMLTVVQTLRLQNRPVWDYLVEAIAAHRSSRPGPQLLGQAGD